MVRSDLRLAHVDVSVGIAGLLRLNRCAVILMDDFELPAAFNAALGIDSVDLVSA
jgi:hypothetical protein